MRPTASWLALALAATACRQPIVRSETVAQRVDPAAVRAEPRTRIDSLRRTANERADSAGALIDTILAAPAQLALRVGDSLQFGRLMRLVARDRSGVEVRGYAPLFHVQPFEVAKLRSGYLVAVDTGNAVLLIRPMRFFVPASTAQRQPLTRVPVRVLAR